MPENGTIPAGTEETTETPEVTTEETQDVTETPETEAGTPETNEDGSASTETPATEEKPAYVLELEKRLEEAESIIKSRAESQPKPAEEKPFVMDDKWLDEQAGHFGFRTFKDEETGKEVTSMSPRQFMKEIFGLVKHAVGEARKYTDETVHGNVSDMRFETVLSDLERKHPDIRKYASAIKGDYLKKRYQPKDFSNPDFIMDGYYWAKGRGPAPAAPVNTTKRNVKVMTPAPAGKGGGQPQGKNTPLGANARQMIASGMFKDEAEYRAWAKADLKKL